MLPTLKGAVIIGQVLSSFTRASYRVLAAAVLTCLAVLTTQPFTEYREMVNLQQRYIDVQHKQHPSQPLTEDDMRPDYEAIEDELQIRLKEASLLPHDLLDWS